MIFDIGPWKYRVRITREPLKWNGMKVDGLCCEADQVILICCKVHPWRRLDILAHELRHAWVWHMGRPEDEEGDADNAGTFAITVMRQLLAQGGEAALEAMQSPSAETNVAPMRMAL